MHFGPRSRHTSLPDVLDSQSYQLVRPSGIVGYLLKSRMARGTIKKRLFCDAKHQWWQNQLKFLFVLVLLVLSKSGVSNLRPMGHMQPCTVHNMALQDPKKNKKVCFFICFNYCILYILYGTQDNSSSLHVAQTSQKIGQARSKYILLVCWDVIQLWFP